MDLLRRIAARMDLLGRKPSRLQRSVQYITLD
jgi:hypothetical protein